MTGQDRPPGGIDTSTPNIARIYDYLLGGKDNFAADRGAAERLIGAIPDVAAITEAGIRQFLDLGSGLPTQANVHELAQAVAPDARVVYVDNDPVVAVHGQALLASGGQAGMVLGDLRNPAAVLQHPAVAGRLDLTRPVAVLCTSTLHFIAGQARLHQIIAGYRDRIAPGSYLAITHGTREGDPRGEGAKAADVFRRASSQLHLRPLPELLRLFDGFELVEPGLVWITQWRPDPQTAPTGRPQSMRGGLGRKP
jgi:hypothetical protein